MTEPTNESDLGKEDETGTPNAESVREAAAKMRAILRPAAERDREHAKEDPSSRRADRIERKTLDDRRAEVELRQQEAWLIGVRQDIAERKSYAGKMFTLICWWLIAVLVLLVFDGVGRGFDIAEPVMLAILGGTTANVLGLFAIVALYLFPNPKGASKSKKAGKNP